jgi:Tfp pilus assembly protein PilO
MTGRDRIVLIGVIVVALLGAGWMLVVSPKRQEAAKLETQVTEAQTHLSSAESQLSSARAAQSQYTKAYASIVSLGKAVPPNQEVPSLIYQLSHATNQKKLEFTSIVSGAGSSGSSATAITAATTGFSQMPFTFVFNGSFFDLEGLFKQLTAFTDTSDKGTLQVSGRLLTIQSVKLSPLASTTTSTANAKAASALTGTITATAYQLPAGQGLTGSATPTSPTGEASPATTTGATSSSTAPAAVARVTP